MVRGSSGYGDRTGSLRRRVIWISYWCLLFVVMHIPMDGVHLIPVSYGDKLIHFASYGLLAWLGARSVAPSGRWNSVRFHIFWAFIYIAYAGLDEWLQSFVGRIASVGDWLSDVGGVVAVSAVLFIRDSGGTLSERLE